METVAELVERLYSKDNKVAYQALQLLESDLVKCIREALMKVDVTIYGDSMQTLVYKDISSSLNKIKL